MNTDRLVIDFSGYKQQSIPSSFELLYEESHDPIQLKEQFKKFSRREGTPGIDQIYAHPQLFLDIFFKRHNQDSLFRRWAMHPEGCELIHRILTNDDFLMAFIHHKRFVTTLTSIYEEQDHHTSALYGLSCEQDLCVLSKILSYLKTPTAIKFSPEMIRLIQMASFTDRHEVLLDKDMDELNEHLDTVIGNFQKIGGNPIVFKTIKDFFIMMLEMTFPPEWEESQPESNASQAPAQATKKKKKRTLKSSLLNDNLYQQTRTEGACKDFNQYVATLEPSLFIDVINDPLFLDVFFKIQSRSLTTGILRGESIFYSWLKHHHHMRPKMMQIISERGHDPAIISGILVTEALLCITQDGISALHLIFQKKNEALIKFFKPVIIELVRLHPQAFLVLLLNISIDKITQTPSSLLTDLLDYETMTSDDIFGALFNDANQTSLLKAMKDAPLPLKSPSLFTPLIQVNTRYPEHPCLQTLLKLHIDHLLDSFSDEASVLELFQTKEKRTRWLALFRQDSFYEAWSRYTFRTDLAKIFLIGCQQNILLNLSCPTETDLPLLLERILNHRQLGIHLRDKKLKKLNEWVQKNNDSSPVPPIAPLMAILASSQQTPAKTAEPEVLLHYLHEAQPKTEAPANLCNDTPPQDADRHPTPTLEFLVDKDLSQSDLVLSERLSLKEMKILALLKTYELTNNPLSFLREQLYLMGLTPDDVDERLHALCMQALIEKPLNTLTLTDCWEELLHPYLPKLTYRDNDPLHKRPCDPQNFFKSHRDICNLLENMLNTDHYRPCLVGSQAKLAAHSSVFNPQKDLDFDILCTQVDPSKLENIKALEQDAMIWLQLLASRVPELKNISSQIKLYDASTQIAWCSFKATIGSTPLDFRFLYSTLTHEETINFSRKERVLNSSAYLWDLSAHQIYQNTSDLFDYIKPSAELTIRNMGYILWTIFCQINASTPPRISAPLMTILNFVLNPDDAPMDRAYSRDYSKRKLNALILKSIFQKFKYKMQEKGLEDPSIILNYLRLYLFNFSPVMNTTPTFLNPTLFFNQISPDSRSPVLSSPHDSERSSSLSEFSNA